MKGPLVCVVLLVLADFLFGQDLDRSTILSDGYGITVPPEVSPDAAANPSLVPFKLQAVLGGGFSYAEPFWLPDHSGFCFFSDAMYVFDLKSRAVSKVWEHPSPSLPSSTYYFTAPRQLLFTGTDGKIYAFDLDKGKLARKYSSLTIDAKSIYNVWCADLIHGAVISRFKMDVYPGHLAGYYLARGDSVTPLDLSAVDKAEGGNASEPDCIRWIPTEPHLLLISEGGDLLTFDTSTRQASVVGRATGGWFEYSTDGRFLATFAQGIQGRLDSQNDNTISIYDGRMDPSTGQLAADSLVDLIGPYGRPRW